MDVRQLAFLARQPSAALKSRERFLGMSKRGLAFILANAMFWQPLLAQADGIVVSAPGTSLGQAGNGVPIVNIAAPNASGLSHNQFHDYNVGAQGLILNNVAAQTGSTQLGGIIVGNPNMTNRVAAQTILNEVNGGSPSQLNGYTEVAGQSARVIVANPYGIGCNGCGFINIPRVTLTTGTPVLDGAGGLDHYQVDGGSVSIDGVGLNANNIDSFEIITRSAKINAAIQANNLAIVAGRNDVNAQTLAATPRAASPADAPALAIDSSALGGMYAGAIKLVGTEAGVGVRLAGNLAASGGDIQLDVNGHLSMAQTAASGAVNVKAASLDVSGPVYAGSSLAATTSGDLNTQQNLAARDRISLSSGGQLSNQAVIEAGLNADNSRNATGDVSITAQNLSNTGSIIASRGLQATVAQTLFNQGGTLSGQGSTQISTATLDNRQKGRVLSQGNLGVTASQLLNSQGGLMTSTGNLSVNAGYADNSGGELSSLAASTLQVATLDNVAGLIGAGQNLSITASGQMNNRGGRVLGQQNLQIGAGALDNSQQGSLVSHGTLDLNLAGTLDNQQKGQLLSGGALTARMAGPLLNQFGLFNAGGNLAISAVSLDNRNGEVSSLGGLTVNTGLADNSSNGQILANGDIALMLTRLNNQLKGVIAGQQNVQINAGQLDNSGAGSLYAKRNLNLVLASQLNNTQGTLRGDGTVNVQAQSLGNNGGSISSAGGLSIASSGAIANEGGALLTDAGLTLTSGSLDNSQQGRIAGKGVVLKTGDFANQQSGSLTSTGGLVLTAGQVNNSAAGRIASAMALTATIAGLDQHTGGQLFSNGDVSLDLSNGQLNNQGGLITAPGQLLLKNLSAVANQGGEISSAKAFILAAQSLDNTGGKLISNQALTVRIDLALANVRGLISGVGVDIGAARLDNSNGSVSSDADLSLKLSGALLNPNGELSSTGNSTIAAMSLGNAGGQVMADQRLSLAISGAVDNQAGTLGAGQGLSASVGSLDNSQAGSLVTDGNLDLDVDTSLNNQSGGSVQAKGLMTIQSQSLDNRGGAINAGKDVQLFIDQLDNGQQGLLGSKGGIAFTGQRLDNQGGLLSAVGLVQLQAGVVLNNAGRIASQSDLIANIDALSQQGGQLVAQGALTLTGSTLDNRQGGLVGATKALKLTVGDIDNRAGEISSAADVSIVGQQLNNSDGGKVVAGTALGLTVANLINQSKGLLFGDTLSLDGTSLNNAGGTLASQNGLAIKLAGDLDNSAGLLSSEATLTVNAASLNDSAGSLSSAGALNVTTVGVLSNQGGSMTTDAGLTLNSGSLDNRNNGVLSGKGATRVTTGAFDNSHGGRLTSADTLGLSAAQVTNQDTGQIASAMALTADVTGLDQQGGELFSNAALSLDLHHGQLNNQGGLINAPGTLLLKNLTDVANQNGEISSAQAFTVDARSLDNSNAKLLSNQALTLHLAQALTNLNGVISAAALDMRSASLDNTNGLISSHDDLNLAVDNALTNHNGTVIADGNLLLSAGVTDNSQGQIAARKDATVTLGSLQQHAGQLIAQGRLSLTADTLDNSLSGLIGATNALDLKVGSVDNRGGEIFSQGGLTLLGQQLDNSDSGQIFAQDTLALKVDQIINRNKGLLSGKAGLSVLGTGLDNTGGTLLSQQGIDVGLGATLDNSLGLFSSEGTLGVRVNALINTAGSLSSAGTLSVSSMGAIRNEGGQLVTDADLNLHSASLDNSQFGTISGKGAVSVTTGAFDNSHGGNLGSGSTLTLDAGQVTNQDNGHIGSNAGLTAHVTGLDQQGGQLFSNTGLTLDLNNGQLNNQNGLINAPTLVLKNLNDVANQGGEISSAQGFTLAAQHLDNSSGKLLSNQAVTLRIAQALSNVKGLIAAASLDAAAASLDNSGGTMTSRGDLTLNVSGLLSNQNGGLINAAQALNIGSADLDNQSGELLGGTALTLDAAALDNRNNGLINSQGGLSLTADRLDSSNGGEVSAVSDIGLNLGALTQNGGRLLSNAGISLDLRGSDLNNQNGLVTAKGPLSISHLRDLNNQGGEVSSSQRFSLAGRTFDNSGGKLISSQQLSLNVGSLLNQNGLISGWQGLDLSAASLDNRNNGTLSSRNGDLSVNVSGALLNSGAGALVSQNALMVSAASLDNSGGILSSGTGQTLTVAGLLNNGQNGLIDSGAALIVQAMTLGNAAGVINAQQDLSFTGSTLDNSAGHLVGNGAITLDLLAVLNNTNGKLASAGPLLIQHSSQINNQGGQLVSQGLLTLFTGGLDNSNRGTVASGGQLLLTATGAVQNNADGLIYSQNGALQLQAASLANSQGALQSLGALGLGVSGDIDNQSGRIIAQAGDFTVSAGNLDNRGGVLASLQGAFSAHLTGVLKNGYDLANHNQGGITQAQSLSLTALAGIDNYGGRISAQTGDALIHTADFDNRNGGLYATGRVNVSANNFDNSGSNDGQIAGSQIDLTLSGALNNQLGIIESDSTLAISAASLDNRTGQLRALGTSGKTNFQIGGVFDNSNGTLETANVDLTLGAGSFLNTGGSVLHVGTGTFDISTANALAAGGTLVTRGGLTLNADSWTNSSVIQAGRLNVNVNNFVQTASGQLLASDSFTGSGGNWHNDGLIASNGSLALALGGAYNGNGSVSGAGNLNLSASQIDLASVASITAGTSATVSTGGSLTNLGRLTSAGALTVNAGYLNNQGTLGSAANLRVNATSLFNQNGLIFSGGDMALRVNDFTNRYADVYSGGDISIARDDNNGRSASISNVSASIESVGDLVLSADSIENRKDVFQATGGLVSGYIGVQCYTCSTLEPLAQVGADSYAVWVENYQSQIVQDSPSASMTAGRNFLASGGAFLNQASTLSAGNNLTLDLQTFTNQGASVGDYTVRRSIALSDQQQTSDFGLWASIMAYNAANDPAYDPGVAGYVGGSDPTFSRPNIHFWNSSGTESVVQVQPHPGGKNLETYIRFGEVHISVPAGSLWYDFALPHYSDGVRAAAPDAIQSATPFDTLVTYNSPTSYASAVVQAGGSVQVNAAQNLTNSVVREGVTTGATASRVGSTQLSGQPAPTIINLNAQLPPNLAQQQVNPLTLPGFSMPTGQNGLFRLSGQDSSATQASLTSSAPQSWTFGGASIASTQRNQAVPNVQSLDLQLGNHTQESAADRHLSNDVRQVNAIAGGASTISVTAPADAGTGAIPLPVHSSDSRDPAVMSGITGSNLAGLPVAAGVLPAPPLTVAPAFASTTPSTVPSQITTAGSQTVARVQGLPSSTGQSQPQKYLIETNPALTDLKQFMSSDYLLAGLGYNPDDSAKRLGDGFYEQRLVQQAVVAGTGQAFIDGETSNDAQFKYLMDNAIASKNELNLSVGVSLTSEQVAALTHDIVWMENEVVDGQTVLVPVLYLANANNRLAPNGALIQGSDVTLIAGQNLDNAGTLKATNNLSAAAGNDLVNSGLIQAGSRLDLLAGNDVVNQAGGIITGRDVSVKAVDGDVINERTVTSHQVSDGSYSQQTDVVDSAARIEAANSLAISAGRDVNNSGGVLSSGANTTINAGRDVNITSVQQVVSNNYGADRYDQTVTQYGSSVAAGQDLSIQAGRDVSVIASQIDAKRDIAIAATGDLTLASAADEQHSYSKTKKVTTQEDHVTQVSTTVNAGGSVALSAGQDLTLVSSKVDAGDEAYLVAGDKLQLLAAQDSDYSLYDMKKKGSFGSKQTQHDEVTQVTNVGSEIKAGGDIGLISSGDQRYQVADLQSGKNLTLQSGGAITFEGVKDLHQETHEKSSNSLTWTSMQGKGSTDETLRQSALVAQGQVTINAVNGLHIDIKQINEKTVSQTIDTMVQADPQLAWLKDAEQRGDVNWQQIKELHDSFKYSHSGLGEGAMLAIIIIVSVLTAGAASTAIGSLAEAGAGSGTALAAGGSEAMMAAGTAVGTASAGWANVALTAAMTSMASTGAVSFIDNKGNLGLALQDTFSSDSLKNAAIGSLTAGAMSYADSSWFQTPSGASNGGSQVTSVGPIQNPGYSGDMLNWGNAEQTVMRSGAHALIGSGISTAVNGGSFAQNLGGALLGEGTDLATAAGNKGIGDLAQELNVDPGSAQTIFLHAVLGGLISAAKGEGFTSGAIAGGAAEGLTPKANELLARYVSENFNADDLSVQGSQNKIATAQMIGLLSAALAGGNPNTGSLIGGAGEKYNSQEHHPSGTSEVDVELRKELGEHVPDQEQEALGDDTIPIDPGLSPGAAGAILGAKGGASEVLTAAENTPLGLGSTGRTVANNLNEQLAMKQVMSNPAVGLELPLPLRDPRWPAADGWVKMSQNVNGVEVHYVRNAVSGFVDDFKFK
ncbi:two-partner secretion domain-containing protein [Pseudomonas botevensis]|uniref:two-partner secretion domain-containing protein n=1 Tax=Pseudomonas botevensis TaxID=2842352 RepID=UPI001C3CD13C|nr:filamentous hemagglutinin N-terminal domain-containing protein [Pseudomonas botevensis]MBV4476866.1 filamentous hemagglutinin N-terminal domain-containing protein [Pseudomonas botevensis]